MVLEKVDTTQTRKNPMCLPNITASQDYKEPYDTDSGYGTSYTTPNSDTNPSSTDAGFGRGSLTGRLLKLPAKHGKLQDFDQAVSTEVLSDFKSIAGSLQGALLDYMRKHFSTHYPMSMRLMVLGTCVEDAKPWIVVFCHESRKRRTQRFFKKSYARGLCQPKPPAILFFEVLVVGHALQTTASPEIEI